MAVMAKVRTIAMAMEVPSMTDSESERLPCCELSTSFTSAVKQHSIVLCALFLSIQVEKSFP